MEIDKTPLYSFELSLNRLNQLAIETKCLKVEELEQLFKREYSEFENAYVILAVLTQLSTLMKEVEEQIRKTAHG